MNGPSSVHPPAIGEWGGREGKSSAGYGIIPEAEFLPAGSKKVLCAMFVKPDLVLLHAPSVYDFRKLPILIEGPGNEGEKIVCEC